MCKIALLLYYIRECQNYLSTFHRKLEVGRHFMRAALLFDQQVPKYNQVC